MLEFDDVHLRYQIDGDDPVHAVAGVTLDIEAGELVALYGPSGSGKTSLLQLAAGLLHPNEGHVRVAGRDVSLLSEREAAHYRMHELGFVTQSFNNLLPGASVLDNAALKALGAGIGWRQARPRVTPLLERLGLGEKLQRKGRQLSMGERQRVMIARALSNDPKLLLADEPTSNLDTSRSCEVLAVLRDLCHERGVAALLVTHDPQAASYADRVRTLQDGRLLACEQEPTATIGA